MGKLPDFDMMMRQQREDPEALERLRQGMICELVSIASNEAKPPLPGLQLMIDMESRHAGTPAAQFLKLSGMMKEASFEFNFCLNDRLEAIAEKHKSPKAVIVQPFKKPSQSSHPSKH
jgi:hypothetical protein